MKIRDSLVQHLSPEETGALLAFNSEVRAFTVGSEFTSIDRARQKALVSMGIKVKPLAQAFTSLWPHWFLNGRSELAAGTMQQARAVCAEILDKLYVGLPGGFYTSPMACLSGMVVTGNRRKAAVARRGGVGTRMVKVCKYHPEKRAAAHGMCSTCYNRWLRLKGEGLVDESLSEAVRKELLSLPSVGRGTRKFKTHAAQVLANVN